MDRLSTQRAQMPTLDAALSFNMPPRLDVASTPSFSHLDGSTLGGSQNTGSQQITPDPSPERGVKVGFRLPSAAPGGIVPPMLGSPGGPASPSTYTAYTAMSRFEAELVTAKRYLHVDYAPRTFTNTLNTSTASAVPNQHASSAGGGNRVMFTSGGSRHSSGFASVDMESSTDSIPLQRPPQHLKPARFMLVDVEPAVLHTGGSKGSTPATTATVTPTAGLSRAIPHFGSLLDGGGDVRRERSGANQTGGRDVRHGRQHSDQATRLVPGGLADANANGGPTRGGATGRDCRLCVLRRQPRRAQQNSHGPRPGCGLCFERQQARREAHGSGPVDALQGNPGPPRAPRRRRRGGSEGCRSEDRREAARHRASADAPGCCRAAGPLAAAASAERCAARRAATARHIVVLLDADAPRNSRHAILVAHGIGACGGDGGAHYHPIV
jgi:hypothetical protein